MKTDRSAAPAPARPLAPIATLLIVAVLAYAAAVGCGGSQTTTTTTTDDAATPPVQPPPDTTLPVSAGGEDGAKIYRDRCVLCHGAQGKGDGVGAAALNPKPRNHTDGTYMNARTDADLLEVIRNGKGQMPAWGKTNILSEDQMVTVLKYVRTLAK